VNTKFVIRGLLIALPTAALLMAIALAVVLARGMIGPPPGSMPPPPTILAPRGEPPAGPVGLQELVMVRDGEYRVAGSGFFLRLDGGQVVGVTTSHSVSLGNPERPIERIALRVAGEPDLLAEFDTLHGLPGQPRTGGDMTVDYVLLRGDPAVDPDLVLTPDPRGAPQPGERVVLCSGQGDGGGGPRVLEGTVQSVSDTAVWVLMDGLFNPGLMSGSPVLSEHTGQAVGMAVATSPRRGQLLIGLHPIGSIVRLAGSATEFPRMAEFQR
jgi:hypothetical protein